MRNPQGCSATSASHFVKRSANQTLSVWIRSPAHAPLPSRRGELPPAEVARYEEQQRYIGRIVALYQSDPDNFAELFSLIQQARRGCWRAGLFPSSRPCKTPVLLRDPAPLAGTRCLHML
jgi:hypothetical protein